MADAVDELVEDLLAYAKSLSTSHPEPDYPDTHQAAMRVPKGGSSCSSCRFVSEDKKECSNEHFIKWNNGSKELPLPADEYCSDWYEPHDVEAYGTSEGVKKAWDTRGRGRKTEPLNGVREAKPEDIKALSDWRRIVAHQEGGKQIKASLRKAANVADWIVADWNDEQTGSHTNKPSKFFVVESSTNGIVGALNIKDSGSSGYDHISSLATRPDVIAGAVQERGVGTRLMLQAARYAAERGHGLDLSSLDGAEGFYRKLGMHETAPKTRAAFAEFEWSPEEVKQMAVGRV
jgi:GNAT superfamily N-acetyltransferase